MVEEIVKDQKCKIKKNQSIHKERRREDKKRINFFQRTSKCDHNNNQNKFKLINWPS